MRIPLALITLAASTLMAASPGSAFCGFYVAKADAKLFNRSSKVVVARKDQRTVVTMASDYHGDPKEFALIVPLPTVVSRDQIQITDNGFIDELDAYTAPRLVEYFDDNPCAYHTAAGSPTSWLVYLTDRVMSNDRLLSPGPSRAETLGITIEARYTVGEYDILILSAKQSDGLSTWLTEEGYRIPAGAAPVLGSYIKQDMKFFVAKVNLREQDRLGFRYLRPIQVAYDTNKFMLPIRLGTVNADGPQDMIVLMLTANGRVETTNYPTQRIPTDVNLPTFTKEEFGSVYKALFDTQVKKDGMKAVYLEYAWNMAWCDPCAAAPIPNPRLRELGAFWLDSSTALPTPAPVLIPSSPAPMGPPANIQPAPKRIGGAANAFITRLHVRYDAQNFPEDLMFQETADTGTFQGRYVLQHPYKGPVTCQDGAEYQKRLMIRRAREVDSLARLTGWARPEIARRMQRVNEPADASLTSP
jgi:hypothetical protein